MNPVYIVVRRTEYEGQANVAVCETTDEAKHVAKCAACGQPCDVRVEVEQWPGGSVVFVAEPPEHSVTLSALRLDEAVRIVTRSAVVEGVVVGLHTTRQGVHVDVQCGDDVVSVDHAHSCVVL